ncbi:MAG: hypothetical protein J6M93_01755 [Succinivibrio sp.]|nr:hypothetical protein [Succinivibrio sp.]
MKDKIKTKTKILSLVCGMVFLSTGCASSSGGEVDPLIANDEASFFSESGGIACATGAFLGALAGALICNDDNRAACMVGGAAGGCGLAMVGNYTLDSIRANYHNTEDRLNAETAEVASSNEKLSFFVDRSKQLLNKEKSELANMEKQLAQGKITRDKLVKKSKSMEENIAYLKKQERGAKEALASYMKNRNELISDSNGRIRNESNLSAQEKQNLARLDQEITKLRSQIDDLNSTTNELSMVYSQYSEGSNS